MSFNPSALNIATVKKFIDRLEKSYKERGVVVKRTAVQEDVAKMFGFTSYHDMNKNLSENSNSTPQTQPLKYSSVIGASARASMLKEIEIAGACSEGVAQTLNTPTLTVGDLFLSEAFERTWSLNEQSKIVIARSLASDPALNKDDIALLVDALSFGSKSKKIRYLNIVGEQTRTSISTAVQQSNLSKEQKDTALETLSDPTLTVERLYCSDAFARTVNFDEKSRISIAKALASDPSLDRDDVALLVDWISMAPPNIDINIWRQANLQKHCASKKVIKK